MSDVFTQAERSRCMAAIKSRGNKATELRLIAIFRAHGVAGWRRHQKVHGKPDFVFRKEKLAVFVDGCFWHGCAKHLRMPKSNLVYWQNKISRNMARDMEIRCALQKAGWKVLRFWEHELAHPARVLKKTTTSINACRMTLGIKRDRISREAKSSRVSEPVSSPRASKMAGERKKTLKN